jgi:hypothetical protein
MFVSVMVFLLLLGIHIDMVNAMTPCACSW